MVAVEHNIVIRRHATFELPIACYVRDPDTGQLLVRDLTGWTGAMQVRATADADTVLAEADVDVDEVNGVVTASIDDSVTADYAWRSGVYDLIITDGVDTEALAAGTARCIQGVTR